MISSDQKPIRLAYADAYPLIRHGICSFLKESDCFEICIHAGNGEELLQWLKNNSLVPDICIIDINMPVKNGYETIKEIKTLWPFMKVLVLTEVSNEYAIVHMLRNGVNGYVLKSSYPDELTRALLSIHNTGNYYSDLTIRHVHNAVSSNCLKINDREIQFLSYCCSDFHYKEIAEKMGVSHRTVDGYREDLFDKLKIKTRTGLAMYAVSIGLLSFSAR